jgi:hypothetical protein
MVIQNLLVFHGKTGGDLDDSNFHLGKCKGAFSATSAMAATRRIAPGQREYNDGLRVR